MDNREFEQTWETEYICERVKRITKDVESGQYESALDYLNMIQEKARAAEKLIKNRSAAKAKEYAKQKIAKLSELEVLKMEGDMSSVADHSKENYGHDKYWAALYDGLKGELNRRHPKK